MFSRKHLAAAAAAAGLVVAGAALADAGDKAQGQGCEGPQASRGEGRHGQGHERMGEMRGRMGEMHARMGAMHGRHGAGAAGQPNEKSEEHKH